MKRKLTRAVVVLALLPILLVVAACGRNNDGAGAAGNYTVTWWEPMHGPVQPNFTNLAETYHAQWLMEKTGITIEFMHPPIGQTAEQFNLMVSAMDLPDIMISNWHTVIAGGPSRAIDDGIILRLNDIWASYSPYVLNYLEVERPDLGRLARTDDGSYFAYPFVREDAILQVVHGPFMRADWLEYLGLGIPETIDDWEVVLTGFRDELGAMGPFAHADWLFINCPILAAFGVRQHFFIDDNGNVAFGNATEQYRAYLTLMSRWFAEGLIDPDFGSLTGDVFNARFLGGDTGATVGPPGGGIGVLLNAADDPNFDIVAVPVPVLQRGQRPVAGHFDLGIPGINSAAITTQASNVPVAARLLDFAFSPEGHILYNFGLEGESFEWVDGIPTFTDNIVYHPDGWPLTQSIAAVARSSTGAPFVQSRHYIMQFFRLPQQQNALFTWLETDSERFILPPLSFTLEEGERVGVLQGDIISFANEMHWSFILGAANVADFDRFVDDLFALGLQELLDIKNTSLQRFHAR